MRVVKRLKAVTDASGICAQSNLNTLSLQRSLFLTQTLLPGHTLTLSFTHAPPAVPWTNHICRLQSGAGSLMCIEQNSRCALYNHWRGKGKEESKRITVKTFPCFLLSACVSLLSCLPCQTGSMPVSLFLYLLRLFLPCPHPTLFVPCLSPCLTLFFFLLNPGRPRCSREGNVSNRKCRSSVVFAAAAAVTPTQTRRRYTVITSFTFPPP